MKNFYLMIITLLCIYPTVVCGQNQQRFTDAEIANMSISDFQAYQKTLQLEAKSKSSILLEPSKLEQYANVGKVLGQAFKDCWSTVSTDAEKFAQSSAGKWTALLITWKIMGKDAVDITKLGVRWIVGGLLFLTITPFFMYMVWKNCATRRVVKKEERTGLFNYKREYEQHEGIHEGFTIAYGGCYLIFLIVTSMLMFL
jgi:hypothetical protein